MVQSSHLNEGQKEGVMEKAVEGRIQDTGTLGRGKLMSNVVLHRKFRVMLDCLGGRNRLPSES